MLSKFLKNIVLVLFLNLLIKPFWILGIDRYVQNTVGAEEYGFYYAIFNFSFLLNIILDLGITNFNNKNISQNNHLLRKHLSNIVVLKLILAGIYLIITIVCGFLVQYTWEHIVMLCFLAFNQILISFIMYLRSNLAGLHLFKIDSLISVLDRTIMIILCSILLWGGLSTKFSIQLYILIQTVAYFITALVTLIIVFKKAKSRFLILNWNLPFNLMIIKKSFPFAILVLLMTFYNRIDTVMMERMLPNGAEQSGIYASAYRLLDATNMIAFLFAALLLPMFSKMIKIKENVEELVKLSFTMLIIPAIVIAFGCLTYSRELMTLMYSNHIEESSAVFKILMTCFVPIATTYVFGTLLTANGNLKYLNIIALSGMILNISLNIFVIPRFQSVGAASASLITQLITSGIQVFLAIKIFKFKTNYKFILKLALYVLGALLIIYFSKYITSNWMINFVLMSLSCMLLSFAVRLFNIKAILKMFKF